MGFGCEVNYLTSRCSELAVIVKTITGIGNESNLTELTLSTEAAALVAQYKDIIREQDMRMQKVRDELKLRHDEAEALRKQLLDAQQSNTQLFDQNILLKAQLAAAIGGAGGNEQQQPVSQSTQISFYEAENARLARELADVNHKLSETKLETTTTETEEEVGKMRREQEELLELLSDQVSGIVGVYLIWMVSQTYIL